MIRISTRKINVHCWGGFGSQLFALILCKSLVAKNPRFKPKIFFHTGGVTLRNPEILELLEGFEYEIKYDFGNNRVESKRRNFSLRATLRDLLTMLLEKSGFLARCNSDAEFEAVSPWVKTIRGHYSYRTLSVDHLYSIFGHIDGPMENKTQIGDVGIHYRLGDLLSLESKTFIAPEKICKVIKRFALPEGDTLIFSDSVDMASALLRSEGLSCIETGGGSLETVQNLRRCGYFVGTSSKISYWVALLRSYDGNGSKTYLPSQDFEQIKMNLGESRTKEIEFYDA